MGVLAKLLPDKVSSCQHIGPLVISSELHIAAIVLIKPVEVIGLHDHIVELKESEALLHTLLIASGCQHMIYREAGSYIPEELYIVEVQEPVSVVDHDGIILAVAEMYEPFHLMPEALTVMGYGLLGHHLAHVSTSRRISYHAGAAAHQGYGLVARHLQPLHQAERHKVAYVQAVRRRIESDVKGGLARIDHVPDLFFVSDLGKEASLYKFLIYSHYLFPLLIYFKTLTRLLMVPYLNPKRP